MGSSIWIFNGNIKLKMLLGLKGELLLMTDEEGMKERHQ